MSYTVVLYCFTFVTNLIIIKKGCTQAFALFSDLESHLNFGQHMTSLVPSESFYDKVRKDWAGKFASVDVVPQTRNDATLYPTTSSTPSASVSSATSLSSTLISKAPLTMGWAINKTTNST